MEYNYEINITDFIKKCVLKWKFVLLVSMIMALVMTGIAIILTKTYYKSSAEMVVISEDSKNPVQNTKIITRSDLVSESLKEIGSSISVSDATNNIKVTRLDYSSIITISYSCENQEETTSFLQKLTNKAITVINELNSYEVKIKKIDKNLNQYRVGPSIPKYSIVGFIGGCIISLLCVLYRYISDNKVRDKYFIENNLGYRVLSNSPIDKGGVIDLRTSILYGFDSIKTIAISCLDTNVDNISWLFAKALTEVNKNVLYITRGDINNLVEAVNNLNNIVDYIFKKDGVSILQYDDSINCNHLQSDKYRSFIDSIKKHYDYIIIETPISSYNDDIAISFNAESDGTILVVYKDITSAKELYEIKTKFEILRINVLGAMYLVESK